MEAGVLYEGCCKSGAEVASFASRIEAPIHSRAQDPCVIGGRHLREEPQQGSGRLKDEAQPM